MKVISDEILHLYLIKPSLLDLSTREDIENRKIKDFNFRKRIEELQIFYKELENINKGVIILTPFKIKKEPDNYKLAAMNNSRYDDEFQYLTTFASAENLIMIRVHYKKSTKEYKLYLVSENMDKVKNVSLTIQGSDKEYITDNEGITTINDLNIDENTIISVKQL